jgi:hypothetical protein
MHPCGGVIKNSVLYVSWFMLKSEEERCSCLSIFRITTGIHYIHITNIEIITEGYNQKKRQNK